MTAHPVFTSGDEEPKRVRIALMAILLGLASAFCFEALSGIEEAKDLAERREHHVKIQHWRDDLCRTYAQRLLSGAVQDDEEYVEADVAEHADRDETVE